MNRGKPLLLGLEFAAWLIFILATVWLRAAAFDNSGFVSHDVGGILYNAMLLDKGQLPYVDSHEMKAPGSFYLAWILAGPNARDIHLLQASANVWAIFSSLCIVAIARRHWGRGAAAFAAVFQLLFAGELDSMDANYITWAHGFQVLALGFVLESVREDVPKLARKCSREVPFSVLLHLGAGFCIGWAGLCKRQAGLALLVCCLAWTFRRHDASRRRAWIAGLSGVVLSQAPIALHFASAGQFETFIEGFVFNRWGVGYVGGDGSPPSAFLTTIHEALDAHAYFLGLLLLPALAGLGRQRGGQTRRQEALLWAWFVVTCTAACLGARFYKGYFLPALAPATLLAVSSAPARQFLEYWRAPGPFQLRRIAVGFMAVIFALGLLRQSIIIDQRRERRRLTYDRGAQAIARHLRPNLEPGQRIWIWGWHLWGVYAYTGSLSASRVYKSFSVITQPPENTWRLPGSKLRFVPGPPAEKLLQDLQANPPIHIVLGGSAPHREFKQLRAFITRNYRRDRSIRLGRVEFWQRR